VVDNVCMHDTGDVPVLRPIYECHLGWLFKMRMHFTIVLVIL